MPELVEGAAPAPADAVTGSTFSVTPNITMTTMPDTNSGTLDSERPVTEMTRFARGPRRAQRPRRR